MVDSETVYVTVVGRKGESRGSDPPTYYPSDTVIVSLLVFTGETETTAIKQVLSQETSVNNSAERQHGADSNVSHSDPGDASDSL